MEQSSFDRIARLLGSSGATTRRSGLASAVCAAIGLAALSGADADAKPDKHAGSGKHKAKGRNSGRDKGKPGVEGPCGDGSRQDNLCSKDKDCCTGICKTGMKNRDGSGRCRCVKKGKPCTEDRNCCGGRACADGVCGGGSQCVATGGACSSADPCCDGNICDSGTCQPPPPPIATGEACVAGDVCADSRATCTSFDQSTQDILGPMPGTYCLLPAGATDCGNPMFPNNFCVGGWCAGGATQGDPSLCGDVQIVSACDSSTDSGAGSTIYAIGPQMLCGVSLINGAPLIFLAGVQGAPSCTSDSECGLIPSQSNVTGSVCVDNSSLSSVTTIIGNAIGGFCVPGAFVCQSDSDCPSFTSSSIYLDACTAGPAGSQKLCRYEP